MKTGHSSSRDSLIKLITLIGAGSILFSLASGGLSVVANAEQLPLKAVLARVQAIHEDTKVLLSKNIELKAKIHTGLRSSQPHTKQPLSGDKAANVSTDGKTNNSHEPASDVNKVGYSPANSSSDHPELSARSEQQLYEKKFLQSSPKQATPNGTYNGNSTTTENYDNTTVIEKTNTALGMIDYAELNEFNHWVEKNLEYAVKNTYATAEALKEEAQQNNGNVEYTEQAISDGIEGVKYWQQALSFQDKTLRNEKFEID